MAQLSAGVRRWVVGTVALPLSARALTTIADRLERAEGRSSVMSRGLRTASKVAGRERSGSRSGKGRGKGTGGTGR